MSTDPSTPQLNDGRHIIPPAQDSPPTSDSTLTNNDNGEQASGKPLHTPRPMRKYTRRQLVALSGSPLVRPPPNMPDLKVWFGSENENLMKKDDPPTPNNARDRRFRRDVEDGDAPSRPSFRSTLSQPSQMGNFKHQSLRPNDRDRDRDRERDGDKDRERDIRDKEGHERLRHLSDKFDRDRLALPLSNSRKDRDSAPHLSANSARGGQPLSSNAASRRGDTREVTKKKVGEASEDWRRGAEPPRSSREDRAETSKREDRDSARSRPRDSSRPKRDSSMPRRDREETREKGRGDREREDSRREKDRDREMEDDDPRHWRDDGKRDERMAARRRDKTTQAQDGNWDSSGDKRWTPGDGVDGRYKRTSARERKSGNDDIRDKEDRREKEKEPAWMDTYVPDSSGGILGGQNPTGELDGIQAWKKEQKEKEKEKENKEKEALVSLPAKDSVEKISSPAAKPPMDEIQLFKLMMKQEEVKRNESNIDVGPRMEQASTENIQRQRQQLEHDPSDDAVFRKSELTSQTSQATTGLSSLSLDTLIRKDPLTGIPGKEPSHVGAVKPPSESPTSNSFQPPAGSRLLAFAKPTTSRAQSDLPDVRSMTAGVPTNTTLLNGGLHGISQDAIQAFSKTDSSRVQQGFSPFDDQNRQVYGFDESRELGIPHNLNTHSRGPVDQNFNLHQVEPNYPNIAAGKGSRFAKFFDGKIRDGQASSNKPQALAGYNSPSPNHLQRHEQTSLVTGNSGDQRAMEDLFAMLSNSVQRGHNNNPLLNNNASFNAPTHGLPQQHLLQQSQLHNNRLEPLYDSRTEDRSFVPDGMVPGLRTAPPPPPRGRDGHFIDHADDPLYNLQRISQASQQGRNIDPLFSGPTPLFPQQGRSSVGINVQSSQPHYRGGPSPSLNQGGLLSNGLQQQQRLPPGLANLGGRPPHDPNQFVGLPGLGSNVPHNGLHGNGPLPPQQQLPFNNFNGINNLNFNGPQVRGPMPGPHNLHNTNVQQHTLPLGGIGHPIMDPRLSNHHQLMGLGGSGITANRLNNTPAFLQQNQGVPPHVGIRPQQQQQHLPPNMHPQVIPPHLQQQGHHPGPNTQPNHDLIALLMGGQHRE